MSVAIVRPTAYAVSCLPPEHIDAYHFTLHVEWRGPGDRWCVTDGAYCYRKDGHRSYESNPSSRTDRFKKAYRFPLDDALALAQRLAPKMTINGHTVESVLAVVSSTEEKPQ
jgi:hypothetical protein